jgi:hypothetical protein
MTTKAQFDEPAQRLLGEEKHSNLLKSGYSRPDFCRKIAHTRSWTICSARRPN